MAIQAEALPCSSQSAEPVRHFAGEKLRWHRIDARLIRSAESAPAPFQSWPPAALATMPHALPPKPGLEVSVAQLFSEAQKSRNNSRPAVARRVAALQSQDALLLGDPPLEEGCESAGTLSPSPLRSLP